MHTHETNRGKIDRCGLCLLSRILYFKYGRLF